MYENIYPPPYYTYVQHIIKSAPFLCALAIATLTACGDEKNITQVNENVGASSVNSLSSLEICNENIYGKMVYVKSEEKIFYCNSEGWSTLDGEDGRNGIDGVDGLNGKDGTNGAPGKDGINGKDGVDGQDALGCTITDKETFIRISCLDGSYDILKTPLETFVDSRDNHIYSSVIIGDQKWMAENLSYQTSSSVCYKNDDDNCDIYGRLYSFANAVNKAEETCGKGHSCSLGYTVQGICPSGWHLPSSDEWNTLFNNVGGKSVAAKMLKSTSWNGTNYFQFSALPGGIYSSSSFSGLSSQAFFWTSTQSDSDNAYRVYFNSDSDAGNAAKTKDNKNSIRCIKD